MPRRLAGHPFMRAIGGHSRWAPLHAFIDKQYASGQWRGIGSGVRRPSIVAYMSVEEWVSPQATTPLPDAIRRA